jgi:hypothetical protein
MQPVLDQNSVHSLIGDPGEGESVWNSAVHLEQDDAVIFELGQQLQKPICA